MEFRGVKLSWIARLYCLLSTEPSSNCGETFADRHETAKFTKFSPLKVSRFTVSRCPRAILSRLVITIIV